MRRIEQTGRWRRVIVAGLAGASVLSGVIYAPTALAQTTPKACGVRTTSRPFAAWGDTNDYFLAPSGNFEHGFGTFRAANSAWVVAENEPWRINGNNDWASAEVGPDGWLGSREFCVASNEDAVRFFFRSPGVPGSGLMVKLTARNPSGPTAVNTYVVDGWAWGWTLSPRINFPNLRDQNGQQYITIEFFPVNNPAWWRVDDVMVDPLRQK